MPNEDIDLVPLECRECELWYIEYTPQGKKFHCPIPWCEHDQPVPELTIKSDKLRSEK
jgi:hypothetical protein